MEIKAQLKRLRIAPRKVRLVTSLLSGLDVVAAKHQLSHLVKRSSKPVEKLINSAAANALDRNGTAKENLYIKTIMVDEGPTLKRYKPKGFGSAAPIAKRTSHITVILEEKIPGLKAVDAQKAKPKDVKDKKEAQTKTDEDTKAATEIKDDNIPEKGKQTAEKELGKKEEVKGVRKFFRRKSI